MSRGLHPVDAFSIGTLSSRDQVTHLVHGLWRYAKSPLANEDDRALAHVTVAAVADWMLRTVTAANGWNFGQADGAPDLRGVCKMRETLPHEAARLASVYAAAWALSGEARYEEALNEGLSESLEMSEKIKEIDRRELIGGCWPDYALMQMVTSLEVIADVVDDQSVRKRLADLTGFVAGIAAERNRRQVPFCPWLCGAAERPLIVFMATAPSLYPAAERDLSAALAESELVSADSTRLVEFSAAVWRYARMMARGDCPP